MIIVILSTVSDLLLDNDYIMLWYKLFNKIRLIIKWPENVYYPFRQHY